MNPSKIGTEKDLEAACKLPSEEADDSSSSSSSSSSEDSSSSSDSDSDSDSDDNSNSANSDILVYQEYIGDPDYNVGQILKENNIRVLDFVRIKHGENV